jgi:N-acetylmuramoyl-L-alanine amidase
MRDVFIPLEDRVAIAQHRGASLFVSMHADALGDHSVRGASVYTLSDTASDAQTAALAQRENAADRFAGPAFRNTPPEVARILASLVRQETRAGSARMARSVVGELGRDVPLLQNPARHAGFLVLKAPDIPSVLVEMGFMSNHQDETELRRPEHRVRVASAMKRAIDGWFQASGRGMRMAG